VRSVLPMLGTGLLAVGFVWFFQGVGMLETGLISDEPLWALLGAVMVASGVGVLSHARASRG
jgi:hypothetical protein